MLVAQSTNIHDEVDPHVAQYSLRILALPCPRATSFGSVILPTFSASPNRNTRHTESSSFPLPFVNEYFHFCRAFSGFDEEELLV